MSTLYSSTLGAEFEKLPGVLQQVHSGAPYIVEGSLRVRWSRHRFIRSLLYLLRFPAPQPAAPCTVHLKPAGRQELWLRKIGVTPMHSRMDYKAPEFITERLGCISLDLHTRRTRRGIVQRSQGLCFLGIPLPFFYIIAREQAVDTHQYYCDVRVYVKKMGLILRYDGILKPQYTPAEREK